VAAAAAERPTPVVAALVVIARPQASPSQQASHSPLR